MGKQHTDLVNLILVNIGIDFPNFARAWGNNTGALKLDDRFLKFGLKGQADISGILANGKRLEIEVKVGKDRQRPAQKNFEKMITRFNGIYILARSWDDVKKVLDDKIIFQGAF